MFDLTGRVAIVTGGNGGIGLGMARGLAKVGARVVIAARNQEKSDAAVRELRALGSDSLAILVDVADEQSVDTLVNKTLKHCGRLDILINNAGVNVRKPPHELTLDEWRQVMDTNSRAPFSAHAAYPIEGARSGKIINIGSMMSLLVRLSRRPTARARAASCNSPSLLQLLGRATTFKSTQSYLAGSTPT